MGTFRLSLVAVSAIAVAAACSQYGSPGPSPTRTDGSVDRVSGQGTGQTPLTAVMQFGQANVGSPFPPTSGHDGSAHAVDNVVPRTVVIGVGGTVTFNVPPAVHQIGIYDDGTQPTDIDTSVLTSLSAFAGCGAPLPPPVTTGPLVIADATNRVAAYPVPCLTPTQVTHTFDTPGRYLVVCLFVPHFGVGMWGWVEVRE